MIKVAILGCGMMGNCHSNAYKDIEEVKVVAVCDLDRTKGEKIAKQHGAKVYTDIEELYKHETFDMLDLCLPTYLHKEYAVQAMKRKYHVFCEKPIAPSVEDGIEMIETAKKEGVKFTVGHVVRFFPAYMKMIEQIKQNKIGMPRLIRTTRNGGFPIWSWEGWYTDYSKSGGPVIDLAIHDIDWIIRYFGKVKRVYAKTINGADRCQDHVLLTLGLEDESIAHVEASWAYPEGTPFGTTVEVIGTKGQIEYDSRKSSPVRKHTNQGSYTQNLYSPVASSYEPYTEEIRAFVQAIIHDEEPVVRGEEAVEAIRVALAAIESDQSHKVINL